MSVVDFAKVLQTPALKNWFQRLSTDNILKISAKELRKRESGAEFNSFVITTDTISEVIAALSDTKEVNQEDIKKVFQTLKTTVYGRNKLPKNLSEPYVSGESLYFPRVSFDSIGTILEKGFKDILVKAREKNPDINISDYFQRGHVFGIFPKKLAITKKSISSNTTLPQDARDLLVGVLGDLEKQLEEEDLATSNLKTDRYTLYAKYRKSSTKYLVELQLRSRNEASGRAQATIATAIRKYLNPGAVTFTSKGIKFTEGAAEQRIKALIESNITKILEAKGSPSMKDLIVLAVQESISGSRKPSIQYMVPYTNIATAVPSKIDTRDINSKVKKERVAVQKLKRSVLAVPRFTRPTESLISSLLPLLNLSLAEQIKKNMGKGSDTKVLNYRTGRLAESVQIERLSESRQGMITAFYSYMRNPYATFSAGGRQEYPKTRDPKLLISKSIRDIAYNLAYTKMRAVNV